VSFNVELILSVIARLERKHWSDADQEERKRWLHHDEKKREAIGEFLGLQSRIKLYLPDGDSACMCSTSSLPI
jgi:hypothetical protein